MDFSKKDIGYLQIILAMIIWGSVGIIGRIIPLSSSVIVFYRVFFAFITLAVYIFLQNRQNLNIKKNNYLILIVAGLFLALNWLFFFRAVKSTTIAAATISYYTSPIILSVFAILFLGEKINRKIIFALLAGFVGLIFILLGKGSQEGVWQLSGILYGLSAAVFYALFALTNKKIKNISSLLTTFVQTGIATVIFLPFVFPLEIPEFKSFILLMIMGIFHTALALIIYVSGLKKIKAQSVGVLSYIDPLSAVILAAIFLGEIPGYMTLLGAVLILGGGYLLLADEF